MPHYNLPHNHGQNIEKVLNKMPSAEGFKDISFLFQQLGDPTRLRILWLLCHCEECVCNLAAAVDMSAPAVSHHLRILKKSGIISSRRDGKEVYYSLSDTPQAKLLPYQSRYYHLCSIYPYVGDPELWAAWLYYGNGRQLRVYPGPLACTDLCTDWTGILADSGCSDCWHLCKRGCGVQLCRSVWDSQYQLRRGNGYIGRHPGCSRFWTA